MGLFGGLKKDVESYFLGYREVRRPNSNEYQLPNISLVKYLTSGDRKKASQHVEELMAMSDALLVRAILNAESSPLSVEVLNNLVDGFKNDLNDEGKQHVESIRPKIAEAINIVHALAKIDGKRIAENPPVAQGIAIDAVSKISEKLVGESDWAISYVTQSHFYFSRLGILKF
jgi:hypothetical protein